VIDDQDVVLLSTEVALEGLKVDEGHVHCLVQRAGLAELALIGADWQKPERALEVQLALRLHRLSRPTG